MALLLLVCCCHCCRHRRRRHSHRRRRLVDWQSLQLADCCSCWQRSMYATVTLFVPWPAAAGVLSCRYVECSLRTLHMYGHRWPTLAAFQSIQFQQRIPQWALPDVVLSAHWLQCEPFEAVMVRHLQPWACMHLSEWYQAPTHTASDGWRP